MRARELLQPLILAVSLGAALVACSAAAPARYNYNLGQPADRATLSAARIAIQPNGGGLPAGHGSVTDGEHLYDERCANCHDSPALPALWGGIGTSSPLSANELYALTAFILYKNGLLSHAATLDASSLSRIHMPNRDGFFISDGKPDM